MSPKSWMDLRKFVVPEFVFGSGALRLAGRYVKNFGGKKALVVTDEGVMRAGLTGKVCSCLDGEGIPYSIFSDVLPNPRASEVMAGARAYTEEKCDIIVAVGGGSPIDCAKGIGIVSTNAQKILDFVGADLIPVPGPPLICVPTTGVSADLSQFAIITDEKERVKRSIASKTLVPDTSLLDPETTVTLPKRLTAITGIDALTHAIEAYVSNASSPITDLLALGALKLIVQHLRSAMDEPDSLYHRSKMMLAGIEAGMAFSNASLGLTHAMSHSIGGYTDFPHGACNAIFSPCVVRFNYDAVPERYETIGKAMGVDLDGLNYEGKKEAVIDAIAKFQEEVGVGKRLGEQGIKKEDIELLARHAMGSLFIVTNPRYPKLEDVIALFEEAF